VIPRRFFSPRKRRLEYPNTGSLPFWTSSGLRRSLPIRFHNWACSSPLRGASRQFFTILAHQTSRVALLKVVAELFVAPSQAVSPASPLSSLTKRYGCGPTSLL